MTAPDVGHLARPVTLAVVGAYVVGIAGVAVWAARRTRTPRDFFIAGQSIGLWVIAMATMSAAFSGFVFVGGPGLTYRIGVSSLFIFLPIGFTGGLLCWVVAPGLRALAVDSDVYTIPDAVRARYGGRAAPASAAIAILLGSVAYLGAQVLAAGRVLEWVLGTRETLGVWSLPVAIAVGLAVVLAYSAAGGMLAGVYTDVLQGGLMMVAAAGLFTVAVRAAGGPAAILEAVAASERFGPMFTHPTAGAGVYTALGFFFVFGIGVLGQPHMLHKFFMIEDPIKLRWLPWVLGASQAACVLVWLGIGFAVPALVARGRVPPLTTPDDAALVFLAGFVPDLLAGVALAGIAAAVMSTSDSFLNLAAAAVVRDLPGALGRKPRNELRAGRAATVVIGLAAGVVAVAWDDLVALIGTLAFGTLAAALVPTIAIGLHWRRATARAATASIAVGVVANLALEAADPPRVLPGAAALALSTVVFVAVGVLDGRARGTTEPGTEDSR